VGEVEKLLCDLTRPRIGLANILADNSGRIIFIKLVSSQSVRTGESWRLGLMRRGRISSGVERVEITTIMYILQVT
jgi:hypothetical protein